jgi:hypothetical protein
MKGYCTPADVRLALAPLDEWDENATAARLTDDQIDDAITEAEGMVDSFVSARYIIPLEDLEDATDPDNIVVWVVSPQPIRGLTRTVAAYLIALTHSKSKSIEEDDPIRLRYATAMQTLGMIKSGAADLPDDFPTKDVTGDITIVNMYEGQLFTMSDVGLVPAGYDPQVYVPYRRW